MAAQIDVSAGGTLRTSRLGDTVALSGDDGAYFLTAEEARQLAALLEQTAAAVDGDRETRELRIGRQIESGRHPGTAPEGPGALTPRELRVLACVAQGMSNREAAAALFVEHATVRNHLCNAYRKLGARNRVEAIAQGVREGWLSDLDPAAERTAGAYLQIEESLWRLQDAAEPGSIAAAKLEWAAREVALVRRRLQQDAP